MRRPHSEPVQDWDNDFLEAAPQSDQYEISFTSFIQTDETDVDLKALKGQPQGTPQLHRLQVVSATGLDQSAIAQLTQHLQSIQLPTGFSGNLVFEFQVSKGRVRQVVFDEQASSVKEQTVIEAIRRSLLIWRSPQAVNSTILLTLQIQP